MSIVEIMLGSMPHTMHKQAHLAYRSLLSLLDNDLRSIRLALCTVAIFVNNVKSIQPIELRTTFLLTIVNSLNVIQLLSFLPWYVGTHVPRVSKWKQGHFVCVLDILLPFCLASC